MTRILKIKIAVFLVWVMTVFGTAFYFHVRQTKETIRRVYKDGFRVGRVVGRDDVLLHLKRSDCFSQSLDSIVQDQDAPLLKSLEENIPKETAVPGNAGKK